MPSREPTTRPSAIILAGGHSRRMGRPKAWLDLGGAPALQRVAEIVRPLADELLVVAAVDQTLPDVDARILRDRVPDLGPLPALALGLENMRGSHAVVLACDTPLARPTLLAWLAETCRARDVDALVPVWDDHLQPLVAAYHRRLAPRLTALVDAGERSLQRLQTVDGVATVPPAELARLDPDGRSFATMNTPAEYEAARARWIDTR